MSSTNDSAAPATTTVSRNRWPAPNPAVRPPRRTWLKSGVAARMAGTGPKTAVAARPGGRGKDQDTPIDGRGLDARQGRRCEAHQQVDTEPGEGHAE